jgi:hypothetical protein
MDAKLTEIFRELDESRADLDAAVDAVAPDRRLVAPGPDQWSVAQVLEHLVITEQRITGLLQKLIDEAKGNPPTELPPPSDFDMRRVLDRTSKIKTRNEPSGMMPVGMSLKGLDVVRAKLKSTVSGEHGVNLATISAPHFVFGQLTVYEWIQFVGSHMRRHAAQIRELSE